MSELRRLLDETESEAERALLRAGISYRSSRETRAKTLTALGLAGSTAIMAGTAASAPATIGLSSLTKLSGAKLVLALSAVGAVTAIPVGYRMAHRRTPAPAAQEGTERRSGARATWAAGGPPAALDLSGAGSTSFRVTASSRGGAVGGSSTGAKVESPSPSVTLTQELAALDAARSMLARGNAQGALFLLDGYGRACPHGKLLRVDALARNGQARAARQAPKSS